MFHLDSSGFNPLKYKKLSRTVVGDLELCYNTHIYFVINVLVASFNTIERFIFSL